MKALVEKMRRRKEGATAEESELSSGMLYATGLVAGGALAGVAIAFLQAAPDFLAKLDIGAKVYKGFRDDLITGNALCAVVFAVLCILLVRNAMKKLET